MSELGEPDEPEDKRRFFAGEFRLKSGNKIELNADDEDGLQDSFRLRFPAIGWGVEARCKDKRRGDHQVREGTPGHKGEQLP